MFLKEQVVISNREVRATMTYWASDRFIVGRAHATEGNDSHVKASGRTHIPDNVELEKI